MSSPAKKPRRRGEIVDAVLLSLEGTGPGVLDAFQGFNGGDFTSEVLTVVDGLHRERPQARLRLDVDFSPGIRGTLNIVTLVDTKSTLSAAGIVDLEDLTVDMAATGRDAARAITVALLQQRAALRESLAESIDLPADE